MSTAVKIVHRGANDWRLKDARNKKEIVLAKAWRELNRLNPNFLSKLLGREVGEDEAQIAATIVQWAGTSEGSKFFEENLKKASGIVKL